MNTNDRIPLYQQIQDYIKTLIESEGLKSGERIPTDKELMELFNVSKITVVNALSGLANDKVIMRVPGRGSFVSDPAERETAAEAAHGAASRLEERPLPGAKTGIIGLVMPSIDDYFAARLIEGIQRGMLDQGYRAVILLSSNQTKLEIEAIRTLREIGAEGMVIFPMDEEQYNEEILAMKLEGYPFLLIDRYLPGVETHYMAADGRMGTELAVDHLWKLGHREIAICSDSPLQTVTVQERIDGYMKALKDRGALINPAHIITDFQVGSLKDADSHPLYRYIRNRMATAYITLNGRLGVQIYQMARHAGLGVPDDLSIVSFDDPTSIVEEFSIFTHIKQFERDMGYRAASRLIEIVKSGSGRGGSYSKTLIKPELIVRQTSGPCRAAAEAGE
ncbi:substrate-binding domain-containing protein [Cohnella sp. REN36]|uniref:substrate-binding domain-containing protein n=1 Tax=Cohnella sp. REN36 TaxID=2887347 RepID=UPI001D14F01B|nr:GntR family transcriptional regulator [Cohnella sp. REN36]MCC3373991.1 GntR family transcriptional regulator [Cohnella sp. REN36]